MAAQNSNNDLTQLKNLVPLNTLSDAQLAHLQKQVVVEQVKKGEFLFREGDQDPQNIYLISGAIALLSGRKEVDVVSSGTQTARFALAHQIPRKLSARAKCPVSFVRIDSSLLSDLLARNQSASYEVNESADSNEIDWMGQLLQSPIFQQIPPANLQRVMMRMSELPVSAGEVIIQQGDEGDYFYLISSGQCRVTRKNSPDEVPSELAVLSAGQGFGEEALLSDKPRSSTVTMLTDGDLVRLSKQDFVELVKQPVSNHIDYVQACQMVQENLVWIDVRTQEEYALAHLPQAINLPYFSLRFQAPNLDEACVYLVYGGEAGQTATAAYLLMERGYEVLVVVQEWLEIASQAGLGVAETASLQDQDSAFGLDQNELTAAVSQESDPPSELQWQQTGSTQILMEKLGQYQTEQKLLKQALAVAKRKLEQSRQEASERQNAQEQELSRFREQLAATDSEQAKYQALEESEHALKSQLKASEERLNQLESELKQARADTQQVNTSLAEYEEAKQQAAESCTVLEQELAELQHQHSSVSGQLEALQTAKQKLETEYQEELEKLRAELAEAERRAKQGEEELVSFRQAVDTTLDENQRQLAQAKEQQGQQAQELTALQGKFEFAQQEAASLNQEHAHLQQAHQAALGQIETLQEQKSKETADLEEQRRGLEQALESTKAETQALREALEEQQQELLALEEQRAEYLARFDQEHQTAEFLRRSLETAENAVEISDNMVEESKREIDRLNQQINDLQSELAEVQANQDAMEQSHQAVVQESQDAFERQQQEHARFIQEKRQEQERLQTEKANMETELAQVQATQQANQQAYDATTAEQQHRIEQLEGELLTMRAEAELSTQNQADTQQQEIALQQAREEISGLTKTIEGLREVQLEMESQLAEDSSGELHRLRTALENEEKKRQQAEQVAKQVDVLRRERAVQETAVEMLGEDIESLTEENTRLNEEKSSLEQEIAVLLAQQSAVNQGKDAQANDSNCELGELTRQRDHALADVDRLNNEVTELRGVIETHVESLQGNDRLDADDEVQALRTELEMVRKKAAEDLTQLRDQLAHSDPKGKQPSDRDVDTVATIQALRQEIDSIQRALADKDQSFRVSQSQCRSLEDAIEDRDKEIDHLRRKLESLLRKTSVLPDVSEMLMSQLTDLSNRTLGEEEQVTLQPTEQLTKGSRDPDLEDLRTPLTRLFRKR